MFLSSFAMQNKGLVGCLPCLPNNTDPKINNNLVKKAVKPNIKLPDLLRPTIRIQSDITSSSSNTTSASETPSPKLELNSSDTTPPYPSQPKGISFGDTSSRFSTLPYPKPPPVRRQRRHSTSLPSSSGSLIRPNYSSLPRPCLRHTHSRSYDDLLGSTKRISSYQKPFSLVPVNNHTNPSSNKTVKFLLPTSTPSPISASATPSFYIHPFIASQYGGNMTLFYPYSTTSGRLYCCHPYLESYYNYHFHHHLHHHHHPSTLLNQFALSLQVKPDQNQEESSSSGRCF